MAYEPKTWECGEVVTAEALNNMEQGIADASSGVDKEIVKIAEFSGIYAHKISANQGCYYAGGGTFIKGDNNAPKTLAELTGGKKVIGIALVGISSESPRLQEGFGEVTCSTGTDSVPISTIPYDMYSTIRSGNICAIFPDSTLSKIEAYAICI